MQVASLAPKVEAMEASWNRVRTISGAETADDVILYWQGLRAKEEQVRSCPGHTACTTQATQGRGIALPIQSSAAAQATQGHDWVMTRQEFEAS
jgi:hypothetical protein